MLGARGPRSQGPLTRGFGSYVSPVWRRGRVAAGPTPPWAERGEPQVGFTGAGSVTAPPPHGCGAGPRRFPGCAGCRGQRGGVGLAGCPAELPRGSLTANKAALMETRCCAKAEHSDPFVRVGFCVVCFFLSRKGVLNNQRGVPVCSPAGGLCWGPAGSGAAAVMANLVPSRSPWVTWGPPWRRSGCRGPLCSNTSCLGLCFNIRSKPSHTHNVVYGS